MPIEFASYHMDDLPSGVFHGSLSLSMAISRNPLDVLRWYPLVMTDIAMENGPVEIVDLSIESGGSFHIYSDGHLYQYRLPIRSQVYPLFSGKSTMLW